MIERRLNRYATTANATSWGAQERWESTDACAVIAIWTKSY
jgi:hypothetical protein